jgi:predicted site-specific integrase-resolvase
MKKNDKQFVKIAAAAEHFGVSKGTIRRWTNTGKISSFRSPSGHRVININPISKQPADESKPQSRFVIIYSRVSSHKQKDDLERQKLYLSDMFKQINAEVETKYIQDIASGLNFKRKGLFRILDAVKEGRVQTIVVASKDRLARFGFDLIKWLCSEYGTEILVLDDNNSTPTEELGKDLLSIVQIYCCKWNGQRRYSKKNNQINEVKTLSNQESEKNTSKLE